MGLPVSGLSGRGEAAGLHGDNRFGLIHVASIAGGKQTGGAFNAVEMSFNIFEPYGFSFIKNLKSKRLFLEIFLFALCLFFLSVHIVQKKHLYEKNKLIQDAVKSVESKLNNKGRILLRHSGTEPKVRVMVESFDLESAQSGADQIVEAVKAQV